VYNISCSDKKVFAVTFVNKFRVIGCIDSGSDVTLMHFSLFKRICKGIVLQKSDVPFITTFSNNGIKVSGMFKCLLKFGTDHIGISCIIYVIPDVQDQAQFLVGQNVLQEGESTMGFKRNENINAPFLVFTKPEICHCILYHESPSKLFT